VDLTIVHPNPVTGRPLRGSAATCLKDKGEQKTRESADSCGRMGVDFSPMVFDTWGGGGLHGAGKEVVKAVFARCTAPLGGPSARGPNDGDNGGAGMGAAALLPNPAFTAAGNPQC